jgi:signal transduction histidine kinase
MVRPDEGRRWPPDRPQLDRPLIQQAAGLMLVLRLVADGLAAFLLLRCYPAAGVASVAFLIQGMFGAHVIFTGLAYGHYRRGVFSQAFVAGDMLLTILVMLVAAHLAEGIYSPILYLLLVEIACFVVIFGPDIGRQAALAAAGGVILEALAAAGGVLKPPGMTQPEPLPRLLEFGTMLAATALLLIGVTRTLRWARAKEEKLRAETKRAQNVAAFQSALADLALAARSEGGLESLLGLVCERARTLLGCEAVMICLLENEALVARAIAPAVDGDAWMSRGLTAHASPGGRAVRERRPVITEKDRPGNVPGVLVDLGVRRVLALPLVGQSGRVLGALSCGDDGRPRDLRIWQLHGELVAAQATAAVERAGLVERLQEEAHHVGAVLQVSQEIGVGHSYNELAASVCRLTRELLAADHASLLCADDEVEEKTCPGTEVEERAKLRQAIASNGAGAPGSRAEARREGRLIVAPLSHAGRVYGCLAALRTVTPGRFDARQVALLEGIARQTGMALDNLRLLEEEREAASLATTLLEVAREFNLALDRASLLSRLGSRAVDLTGAAASVISIWQPRERVYRIESVHGSSDSRSLLNVDFASPVYRGGTDRLRLEPAWLARFGTALGVSGEAVTELSVALERGGETAGVLTLIWGAGQEPGPRQIALARGLTNQAAIALQNVRLLEEIREASRVKSEFVATMSHELRTPLNVILGYLTLFLEGSFGGLDDEQRGILRRMERSARELFDLVTATLDLNRLEAGRSRVTVESVDVSDLFTQLELETVPGLEREKVEVRWQLASNLPALETDRAKLRIVLRNLVGNAIKFTERGSVTITAEPGEGAVVFTVADTGPGIRREDLPVIFEMFRQVESVNTRKHGGVGLGLYIVKRLLAELRGEIDVESDVGSGSRFRVRIPVRLPVVPAVAAAAPLSA